MERLACVDVPALPLQILLREHPAWSAHPAVVVEEDRPLAPIAWVNERARAMRILPGVKYAAALSLAHDLRAGVVEEHRVERVVDGLCERLRSFSPHVEPSQAEPGVFWIDAGGLRHVAPSLSSWARGLVAELEQLGFEARVSVGFTRFGSYAAVKGGGPEVQDDPAAERRFALGVPLARLAIDPGFRDALRKLGVTDLGGLVDLPPAGIRERFGPDAHRLHRLAAGDLWAPLRPRPPDEPVQDRLLLTEPVQDVTQLLFHVKGLIHPLLATLEARGEALTGLDLRLILERGADHADAVEPAAPTLDEAELMLLCRLRLEAIELPSGVIEIHLRTHAVPARATQERLLTGHPQGRPRRDLEEADRTLAFLRAEHGHDAVVHAELRDGHLPESRFAFVPLTRTTPPTPRPSPSPPPLVRRLFHRPTTINAFNPGFPEVWLLRGMGLGKVIQMHGPFTIAGGWWSRELHRDYHVVEVERGDLLWMYRDKVRRRWCLQGRVE